MIKGDFSRKSQTFPFIRVFCASAEGVPFGIGYRRWGSRNNNDGATGPKKKCDDIFSPVDTMYRQTDGQTPGDSKDRAYA